MIDSNNDILTFGCSFTANDEMTWVKYLKNNHPNTFNYASAASGNDYIFRNILYNIKNHKNPIVLIQLSGFHRKSFLVDDKNPLFKTFKNDLRDWSHLCSDFTHINDAKYENKFWLKMAGWNITHEDESKIIEKNLFSIYKKYIHNKLQSDMESLENIINIQNFLKINNINYKMFFWRDELSHVEKTIETDNYIDIIDFNKFWFYGKFGGMVEFLTDNFPDNDYHNGTHPNLHEHKLFYEKVIQCF